MQRLQEELEGQQAMLAARQEGEALLKAEVAKLAEENGRLEKKIAEHQVCPIIVFHLSYFFRHIYSIKKCFFFKKKIAN